jgi:[citrate (pro-3S)-lyase] ligase
MAAESFGWEERILRSGDELAARGRLLAESGLAVPGGEELILGLYEDENLIATGALVGAVLQGIAVSPAARGEGAAAAIVSSLITAAVARGKEQLFLFTQAKEAVRFEALGFSLVATAGAGGAALLEWGSRGIERWLDGVRILAEGKPEGAGAVVVNCNPFTLGHRALIESAAAKVPWLYALVVEEDRSLFPFAARLELVRRGTADLPNVTVMAGGPYVISSATFPTYFIRPAADGTDRADKAIEMHAALDLAIFRSRIAPALRVTDRFVGTEPYCATTASYNRLMKSILASPEGDGAPLRVHEMPRFERGGAAVSASTVRSLIRSGKLAAVEDIVPATTWAWLNSPEAAPVLERIRRSDSRH